jgi:hypothetical protein
VHAPQVNSYTFFYLLCLFLNNLSKLGSVMQQKGGLRGGSEVINGRCMDARETNTIGSSDAGRGDQVETTTALRHCSSLDLLYWAECNNR